MNHQHIKLEQYQRRLLLEHHKSKTASGHEEQQDLSKDNPNAGNSTNKHQEKDKEIDDELLFTCTNELEMGMTEFICYFKLYKSMY